MIRVIIWFNEMLNIKSFTSDIWATEITDVVCLQFVTISCDLLLAAYLLQCLVTQFAFLLVFSPFCLPMFSHLSGRATDDTYEYNPARAIIPSPSNSNHAYRKSLRWNVRMSRCGKKNSVWQLYLHNIRLVCESVHNEVPPTAGDSLAFVWQRNERNDFRILGECLLKWMIMRTKYE